MENITRGGVEFSHGLPISVERVHKVKKVGVYPMNGVRYIHNESGETNQNNIKICNISFPNIFINIINQRVDITQLDTYQNVLPSSSSCTE